MRLGIRRTALQWIQSYLSDRTMSVKIQDHYSTVCRSQYGVPQGSVLGPLLFTIYILPIGDIIRKHSLNFHLYADDNQIYISFKTTDLSLNLTLLERCINDIRSWMSYNYLKLNDEKTEFLILGSRQQLRKLHPDSVFLRIGDTTVYPTASARNLGITFDCAMTMDSHISLASRACFYSIYNISKVRHLLDTQTVKLLMQCLVISKLDYCNALYANLPKKTLSKLQHIQNSAARCITKASRYDHISPVLKALHWLPVSSRVIFKICIIIHDSAIVTILTILKSS